jgi:glyoxylase I family protein
MALEPSLVKFTEERRTTMFKCTGIDHAAINTNDMEATLQFYCGILGMRLARTSRTGDGRRHYNVEIGGGNAFAVFDGADAPPQGVQQLLNHFALTVATEAEFDEVNQRLKDHGIEVTDIIQRGYGKTFYFHDPNGIRLQIELQTRETEEDLNEDPDPVPYVRQLVGQT